MKVEEKLGELFKELRGLTIDAIAGAFGVSQEAGEIGDYYNGDCYNSYTGEWSIPVEHFICDDGCIILLTGRSECVFTHNRFPGDYFHFSLTDYYEDEAECWGPYFDYDDE